MVNTSKIPKSRKQSHTSRSKIGMGDYYGSGIKNPTGKMRSDSMSVPVSPSKLKKPPKSLA